MKNKIDINERIRNNISNRRYKDALIHLSCSIDDLRQHLESQFGPDMNWDNYGNHGWNIDHIIPLASTKDHFERIKLHHYKNLRPLWALYNQQKSDRLDWKLNDRRKPLITVSPMDELRLSISLGSPFSNKEAGENGCSASLLNYYVERGLLHRLGGGLYSFPDDAPSLGYYLKYISPNDCDFHVGGATALLWRDIYHNIYFKETITLFGKTDMQLPKWFQNHFLGHYTARKVFNKQLPKGFGLTVLPDKATVVPVSSVERALLEMLSEVGVSRNIESAKNIMENIRNVQLNALTKLLNCCSSIKTFRLCLNLSKDLNLSWSKDIRDMVRSEKLGGSRWMSKLKDGTILILNPVL